MKHCSLKLSASLLIVYAISQVFIVPVSLQLQLHVPRTQTETSVQIAPLARGFLPTVSAAPSVHASTLTQLKDGKIAAAWFGGTREGAHDVKIYFSIFETSGWTAPQVIADPSSTGSALGVRVSKVGNPVLFVSADGQLNLYYVTTDWMGWAFSRINYKYSRDNGRTWSGVERLSVEPTLNTSALVRNGMFECVNGDYILPAYFEQAGKHPELLIVHGGTVRYKYSYPQMNGAIQPALVTAPNGNIYMYCRDANAAEEKIQVAEINCQADFVKRFTLAIDNSDASVAAVNFGDYIVIAANPTKQRQRNVLALFASTDGVNFTKIKQLAYSSQGEFSYPSLLVVNDQLCISYTYNRQKIAFDVIGYSDIHAIMKGK